MEDFSDTLPQAWFDLADPPGEEDGVLVDPPPRAVPFERGSYAGAAFRRAPPPVHRPMLGDAPR